MIIAFNYNVFLYSTISRKNITSRINCIAEIEKKVKKEFNIAVPNSQSDKWKRRQAIIVRIRKIGFSVVDLIVQQTDLSSYDNFENPV